MDVFLVFFINKFTKHVSSCFSIWQDIFFPPICTVCISWSLLRSWLILYDPICVWQTLPHSLPREIPMGTGKPIFLPIWVLPRSGKPGPHGISNFSGWVKYPENSRCIVRLSDGFFATQPVFLPSCGLPKCDQPKKWSQDMGRHGISKLLVLAFWRSFSFLRWGGAFQAPNLRYGTFFMFFCVVLL